MDERTAEELFDEVLRGIVTEAGQRTNKELVALAALLLLLGRQLREQFPYSRALREAEAVALRLAAMNMATAVAGGTQAAIARAVRDTYESIRNRIGEAHVEIGKSFSIDLTEVIRLRMAQVGQQAGLRTAGLRRRGTVGTAMDSSLRSVGVAVDVLINAGVRAGIPVERVASDIAASLSGAEFSLRDYHLRDVDISALRRIKNEGTRDLISEVNNTRRAAVAEALENGGFVQAARWTLSARHHGLPSSPDVCDLIAARNVGLGVGMYQVKQWPDAPHPHCGCYQAAPLQVRPPRQWAEELAAAAVVA